MKRGFSRWIHCHVYEHILGYMSTVPISCKENIGKKSHESLSTWTEWLAMTRSRTDRYNFSTFLPWEFNKGRYWIRVELGATIFLDGTTAALWQSEMLLSGSHTVLFKVRKYATFFLEVRTSTYTGRYSHQQVFFQPGWSATALYLLLWATKSKIKVILIHIQKNIVDLIIM